MILFTSGFRAFFLAAGLVAMLLVPLWLVALTGHGPPGVDLSWHAHELVQGYVLAVLAGFFLTAVPKWTQTTPVTGAPLAGLVALWTLGRIVRLTTGGPLALLDTLFPLALAAAIGWPIFRSRSTRNGLFPVLLLCIAGADAVGHLDPASALAMQRVAVLSAVGVVVIFGGRITPMFTRNALRGVATVRDRSWLDDAAIACVLLLVPLAALPGLERVTAAVAITGAVLNAARMVGWATQHTARQPIVWVLHAGYAWVAVALAAWGLAAVRPDLLLVSTALHAFTVGVLGTYTLGMMSRVSLGHTGRPLRTPTPVAVAYGLVLLAGLVRLLGPLVPAGASPWAIHLSGTLWTVAFALFVGAYLPILTRPREDGAPG